MAGERDVLAEVGTRLANAVLDRPFADPDDDAAKEARAFLRLAAPSPEPLPLDVERLARALRVMLDQRPNDDTRSDYGDLMALRRPREAAAAIAEAYAREYAALREDQPT